MCNCNWCQQQLQLQLPPARATAMRMDDGEVTRVDTDLSLTRSAPYSIGRTYLSAFHMAVGTRASECQLWARVLPAAVQASTMFKISRQEASASPSHHAACCQLACWTDIKECRGFGQSAPQSCPSVMAMALQGAARPLLLLFINARRAAC